jgi:hypothetical protein
MKQVVLVVVPMRHSLAVGCLFLAWAVIPPNAANATCGEECDQQYSSDVDDCHSNFGDDPADADDLANSSGKPETTIEAAWTIAPVRRFRGHAGAD